MAPAGGRGRAAPQPEQALVMSTGIIGQFLPMDKIAAGIRAAAARLGDRRGGLPGRGPRDH